MSSKIMPSMAIAALCLLACSKTRIDSSPNPIPVPIVVYDIVTTFAANAPAAKTVTIVATAGGTFTGNGGARYTFPSNAFVTATGAPVTGSVTVRAAEMLNKSDMIFSGILPISNGEPLISGGEVYLKVTQGSNMLRMAPGKMYTVSMPQKGTPVAGMQLFYAAGAYKSTIDAGVNWQPNKDSTGATIVYNGDSISIISDSIGFANADRFMSNPQYQSITVTPTAAGKTFSKDSMVAYALYDEYNGVWPMAIYNNGRYVEGHVPNIPLHFLVVAIINGVMYAGSTGATPATGTNYDVALTPITSSELKAMVKAL
jgi:hypothetical protein